MRSGRARVAALEGGAIAVAGFALWLSTGRALRANLFALERDLVFAPGFTLCVLAALAIALLVSLRGIDAVRTRRAATLAFVCVEGPLALIVCVLCAFLVNAWRIRSDMSTLTQIAPGDPLPLLVSWVGRGPVFYVVTAALAAAIVYALFSAHYGQQEVHNDHPTKL